MTTSTIEQPTTTLLPDLTGHDRCDSGGCNAQAYVRARFAAADLVFCGHHYARHETAIAAHGVPVRDERDRLSVSYVDVEATELAS